MKNKNPFCIIHTLKREILLGQEFTGQCYGELNIKIVVEMIKQSFGISLKRRVGAA